MSMNRTSLATVGLVSALLATGCDIPRIRPPSHGLRERPVEITVKVPELPTRAEAPRRVAAFAGVIEGTFAGTYNADENTFDGVIRDT